MHALGLTHFLQQFLAPQSLKQFKLPWRLLLDEDPAKVAEQLRAEGLLEQQGELWVCTAAGRVRAEEFARSQAAQRSRTEAEVLKALSVGDFARVADAYLAFESCQPFPNDVALNPTAASRQSLCNDLQELAKPCRDRELLAQVLLVWLWIDSPALTAAGEIVRSSVVNRRDLQRFAQEGLAQIQILAANPEHCCAQCLPLHEKLFEINQVPELPVATCENRPPCLLAYLPDMS